VERVFDAVVLEELVELPLEIFLAALLVDADDPLVDADGVDATGPLVDADGVDATGPLDDADGVDATGPLDDADDPLVDADDPLVPDEASVDWSLAFLLSEGSFESSL
jgi:hypothetical protein